MFVRHVALVTEELNVPVRQLTRVAAALQKQVTRDFAPIWEIKAHVNAFTSLDDVPSDYWPVIVVEDVKGAAGVHEDQDGQPFALVEFGQDWSLTASHETLEMLGDPFGRRLVAGQSPRPGQGRVQFLVEVCDPSEAAEFGYTVNGIPVSDFYTPNFFDPEAAAGVRYSFTGAIKAPRQVLRGGYLSWHDPVSDHWFQQVFFGHSPEFRDLGSFTQSGRSIRTSLRSLIDAKTPEGRKFTRAVADSRANLLRANGEASDQSSAARAKSLRAQIDALRK